MFGCVMLYHIKTYMFSWACVRTAMAGWLHAVRGVFLDSSLAESVFQI